jgi:hypothetical protein
MLNKYWDYVLFFDVLEHIEEEDIKCLFSIMLEGKVNRIVVKIPVCANEGEKFVLDVSNMDITHITCHTKEWWTNLFYKYGFVIEKTLNTTYLYDSDGVFVAVFKKVNF